MRLYLPKEGIIISFSFLLIFAWFYPTQIPPKIERDDPKK